MQAGVGRCRWSGQGCGQVQAIVRAGTGRGMGKCEQGWAGMDRYVGRYRQGCGKVQAMVWAGVSRCRQGWAGVWAGAGRALCRAPTSPYSWHILVAAAP